MKCIINFAVRFKFFRCNNKWFIFIEIEDENELEKLKRPEQRIDTQQLCIDLYKTFFWKGYGKHTSEEFWTDSISIDKFLEQWQTSVKNLQK